MADWERKPMACRICRGAVNRFVGFDDEAVEWVHARSWEEHDHEPEPVPAGAGGVLLSCDFCGDADPRWQYEADSDVTVLEGPMVRTLGHRWAGCDDCDPLVRGRRLDALMARHIQRPAFRTERVKVEAKLGRRLTDAEMAEVVDNKRRIIGAYIGRIIRRGLIPPPPPPPAELTPYRLHKVRDRLVKMWAGDTYRATLVSGAPIDDPVVLPGEDVDVDGFSVALSRVSAEQADRFCARMQRGAQVAELFWVSGEFTTLAVAAGKKLPDYTITREELPSTAGLLVYQQPIIELSIAERTSLVVAAGWTLVPDGVWLTLYAQPEQVFPELPLDLLREDPGYLLPVAPGAGMRFGTHPDRGFDTSGAWGTLLSTWFLMRQSGVAVQREAPPDKSYRRAYARTHDGRQPPPVRVVELRRQPRRQPVDAGGGGGRTLSVRSLVGKDTGGFWKDQPYGPKSGLRKRIWINPFIRGPEGAPFKVDVPVVMVRR